MKNMRSLVIGVLAIALVCGVAWVLESKRPTAQEEPRAVIIHNNRTPLRTKTSGHRTEPQMARAPAQSQPLEQESSAPVRSKRQPKPVEPQTAANQTQPAAAQADAVTPSATQTPQGTPTAEETLQDAMAQAALAYIGGDPNAETDWYEATSDPNLSAQGPQDMTADSNEGSPSNSQAPTTDNLP
jgi:hypothetical protein